MKKDKRLDKFQKLINNKLIKKLLNGDFQLRSEQEVIDQLKKRKVARIPGKNDI